MKTLEDFLDLAYVDEDGIISTPNILSAVRGWLEQNRPDKQRCDNSECPECQAKETEDALIDKLLEGAGK